MLSQGKLLASHNKTRLLPYRRSGLLAGAGRANNANNVGNVNNVNGVAGSNTFTINKVIILAANNS
jgi:hypothetical protein